MTSIIVPLESAMKDYNLCQKDGLFSFLCTRQTEWPVQVRGGLQLCLQPAGDRRLDRREEREAGQEAAL